MNQSETTARSSSAPRLFSPFFLEEKRPYLLLGIRFHLCVPRPIRSSLVSIRHFLNVICDCT
jgi:hypothetical protein